MLADYQSRNHRNCKSKNGQGIFVKKLISAEEKNSAEKLIFEDAQVLQERSCRSLGNGLEKSEGVFEHLRKSCHEYLEDVKRYMKISECSRR